MLSTVLTGKKLSQLLMYRIKLNRDPPWMTEKIKLLKGIIEIIKLYKQYMKNGRKKTDYEKPLSMANRIKVEISNSKKSYFDDLAENLYDPKLNRKVHLGILKSYAKWKKIQFYLLCS